MISAAEWTRIPLEARLVEHATHSEDELLQADLLEAVKKLDALTLRISEASSEIVRLERIAALTSPY